jgi:hypothetical protein
VLMMLSLLVRATVHPFRMVHQTTK